MQSRPQGIELYIFSQNPRILLSNISIESQVKQVPIQPRFFEGGAGLGPRLLGFPVSVFPAIQPARSKFWIEAAGLLPTAPKGLLFCISSNSALVSGSTAMKSAYNCLRNQMVPLRVTYYSPSNTAFRKPSPWMQFP